MKTPTLALFALFLALGCEPPPLERSQDGGPEETRADARRPELHYRWCIQPLGDGGRDALGPGSACDEAAGDRCGVPVECTFESAGYASRCELIEGAQRCCHYATTHSQVTGGLERCRDCGDGMVCSPID